MRKRERERNKPIKIEDVRFSIKRDKRRYTIKLVQADGVYKMMPTKPIYQ